MNVLRGLDLVDTHNRPDHGKILPTIALLWLLVLASAGNLPKLPYLLALISASHGYAGWRTFLRVRYPRPPKPPAAEVPNAIQPPE